MPKMRKERKIVKTQLKAIRARNRVERKGDEKRKRERKWKWRKKKGQKENRRTKEASQEGRK